MAANQPGKGGARRSGESAEEHRDLVNWTRVVGIATVALVIANGLALFFIYQQWRTAADTQIDTRSQLRSVVSLQPFTIIMNSNWDTTNYGFVENLQNVEGTRTDHFSGWLSVRFFEGGVPNNIDLTKPAIHVDVTTSIVGPNSGVQIAVGLTPEEDKKFGDKSVEGVALVWGDSEYSDIFDPHIVHHIRICKTITRPFDAKTTQSYMVQMSGPPAAGAPPAPVQLIPYNPDCDKNT